MNLQGVIITLENEMSQTEKEKHYMFSLACGIQKKWLN